MKQQQQLLQRSEKELKTQMIELQNKVNVLTHQLRATADELEAERKEKLDVQQKYSEKARLIRTPTSQDSSSPSTRQHRKLTELYDALKRRLDRASPGRPLSSPVRSTSTTLHTLKGG